MVNNRTSQLLPASFKGVAFPIRSESAPELGRKLVLHDYVNSSLRFVEDQGQIPPKFTIPAFVHGPDFIARAARLEQALNEPGAGQLFLPAFGVVTAFAGQYSKEASQKSVGEISYNLTFVTGKPGPGPNVSRVGVEDVYQFGDEARKTIEDVFAEIYPSPETSVNAVAAIGDLNSIAKNIENTIKTILPVEDLDRVFNYTETVQLNAAKLVRNSQSLASLTFSGDPTIPGLWQQISLGLSREVALGKGIEALSLMTNIGGGLSLSINDINRAVSVATGTPNIPLWPETTRQRIDRNTARQVIAQANRISSLVGLYEVVASKSYTTDIEIDTVRGTVENLHERIMRDETVDYSLIQSNPSVRSAIEAVRLSSLAVLGQKEQEAFEIVEDMTGSPTSALVRSYDLYAEDFIDIKGLTDRTTQIAKLNPSQPSIGMINRFKVFHA